MSSLLWLVRGRFANVWFLPIWSILLPMYVFLTGMGRDWYLVLYTLFDTTVVRCWVSSRSCFPLSTLFSLLPLHHCRLADLSQCSCAAPTALGANDSMALIHELRNGHFASAGSSDTGNNNNNNNNGGGNGNGSGSGNNPTDIFLLSMSRQNFQAILNAVFKMEQYWAGVTGVSQLLEKRTSCFDQDELWGNW